MKYMIYGLNYSPEPTGIGKYSGEMGSWLSAKGHEVKVVAAPPYYPHWSIQEGYANSYCVEKIDGVLVYRCPLYIPSSPDTKRRIAHLLSFVVSSFFVLIRHLRWRPGFVINVVPTIFTAIPAWIYARLTGAKFVIHIQDFESDAMFGLGMVKGGLLQTIWSKFERFLMRRADFVSTISNAMVNNAIAKGVDSKRIILFPNWSELDHFSNPSGVEAFRESLYLPSNKKLVLYSGNLGQKQGLEIVLEAAHLMSDDQRYYFIICGDGAAKTKLVEVALKLGLKNISFLPLQPYEKLPKLLAMARVHLVVQNSGVADAVLPSKLTNILAVGGNAVITAEDHTEMGILVKRNQGIAVITSPENAQALVSGILEAGSLPLSNKVALDYAMKMLDKDQVLNTFFYQLSKCQSFTSASKDSGKT